MSTRHDDYLWDPRAEADPVIAGLEKRLAPLTFDPVARPLPLSPADARAGIRLGAGVAAGHGISAPRASVWRRRPVSRYAQWTIAACAATLLLALVSWQLLSWRLEWPAGAAWAVDGEAPLTVGAPRTFADGRPRIVDIARLGHLRAAPGTTLTLRATGTSGHTIDLAAGSLDVRLWAPPGRLRVGTPAGTITDLGCVFRLDVDDDGHARLAVDSGWVQLDNAFGESLVPAGASSAMRSDRAPLVPLFDDGVPAFRSAVRAVEADTSSGEVVNRLRDALSHARARDVFTLLMLARRSGAGVRQMVVDRAALLVPPPPDVSAAAVARGDDGQLWRWVDALALPPVKGWWRNWRDGLPRLAR